MTIRLIGCASGIAGADIRVGEGPNSVRRSSAISALEKSGHIQWQKILIPTMTKSRKDEILRQLYMELAKEVSSILTAKNKFCVLGGDHSCAVGTWSGVYDAFHKQGDIGLIWIDAHMDSHTPETSQTGNIHGMPAASLLGYGYPTLTGVLHDAPKLKPENLCFIGVRSFEAGEEALLKRLNVKVYYMDEVRQRGFGDVLKDAAAHVSKHTIGYGISLDIDSIDPLEAPGVDVPEPDGIRFADMLEGLTNIMSDKKLIGTEIVEFDPSKDKNGVTEKIVTDILTTIAMV
jgi:arginase